jgi:hypothetical protein
LSLIDVVVLVIWFGLTVAGIRGIRQLWAASPDIVDAMRRAKAPGSWMWPPDRYRLARASSPAIVFGLFLGLSYIGVKVGESRGHGLATDLGVVAGLVATIAFCLMISTAAVGRPKFMVPRPFR